MSIRWGIHKLWFRITGDHGILLEAIKNRRSKGRFICDVLNEVFNLTKSDEIRSRVVEAEKMAKKMHYKLLWYKNKEKCV